jgi:hypothetical protein
MKNNPLQETLAERFDMSQSMTNKWVHVLMPLLRKALSKHEPAEKAAAADFSAPVIMDVTERRIQRPRHDQQ